MCNLPWEHVEPGISVAPDAAVVDLRTDPPQRDSRRINALPNCRDLGGLTVGREATGVTRFGVLLRTASLARTTADLFGSLPDHQRPATYIDLRTSEEIDRDGPCAVVEQAGTQLVHIPIASDPGTVRSRRRPQPSDYVAAYRSLLPAALDVAATLARMVGRNDGTPTMFGCSAGKDRTGVVAALLLRFAGVPRATISRDYALSSRCLRPELDLFRSEWERKGLSRADYAVRVECVRGTMSEALAPLLQAYPTPSGIAAHAGLSPTDAAAFNRAFVVKPGATG